MTTKAKCKVDSDGSVCLEDILTSFNSSVREEHAWALCYQCAKFFLESGQHSAYHNITDVDQVYFQTDGNIHPNTRLGKTPDNNRRVCSEQELVTSLGVVIYNALDKGYDADEERSISQDLNTLINDMITDDHNLSHHETDDEGIERDSEEADESSTSRVSQHITLTQVIARCERHLASLTKSQAESHYRAVVRALVAEAIELSTFLEKVAQDTSNLVEGTGNRDLEQLKFADWARFWVQVIQELRKGVKLKKVNCSRAPIEYELTPYEILMNDIKSCRYSLRKIMVDGNVPSRVTKDAHAIILEFIRSRPTLRKVSERKLPPHTRTLTPREQLMNSIRKGRTLRKTHTVAKDGPVVGTVKEPEEKKTRKLIKVDFSKLDDDDDDISDTSDGYWQEEFNQVYENVVEAYDLALQGPAPKPPGKRHLNVYNDQFESYSVPQSRPGSRQSCTSSDAESVQLTPEIAQAVQDNNTKPWHEAISLDDRLSLTLEEIVHIRTVLTKAEVEALPIEGHVKSDVENSKVCFLCLKTRFGILGPWGQRCRLCKRTVCSKCISKMCIPMEHFASVPVVLLSPSIMATPEDEFQNGFKPKTSPSDGSNSANSSTQPSPSRPSSSLERFRRQNTAKVGAIDKTRGSLMAVCLDCKMMVLQIIKSAQANRSAIRNKHLQTLTLNISPVF
ncbi:protein spire [Onthophagus taurus]|uniref:protein spire n=1 Tax=Onthophagus taurus TaxID=166361 RepID=UPI000C20A0B9|nr:protein spire [Onthophagus taurus]